jgi:hypothetical protein
MSTPNILGQSIAQGLGTPTFAPARLRDLSAPVDATEAARIGAPDDLFVSGVDRQVSRGAIQDLESLVDPDVPDGRTRLERRADEQDLTRRLDDTRTLVLTAPLRPSTAIDVIA